MWEDANRVIVDATYSGRAHQLIGTRWDRINRWLGVPAAVLSAFLAGGAGVTALVGTETWITATLALVAAGLAAARSFLRPDETAELYGLKGDRFISLRNDAQRFQQIDLRSSLSLDALNDRSKNLSERRNTLREQPPHHIPRWAYEKTKKSIEAGESGYENDPLWLKAPF
jgi:hypothetical protein